MGHFLLRFMGGILIPLGLGLYCVVGGWLLAKILARPSRG